MRTESTTTAALVHLTATELTQLTSVVAETLATNVQAQPKKIFTAANLWNVQNQRRVFATRRFI
ncbi:hypothetical protein [Ferruginibacter sp. HRS2-29]|uniref:hypothetical protein n=1 Tax=Ferruginibacter sp. HRS2-29 TaxID=2487334 RepID=UPI0020CE6522|nr:hypothetical protein [Ferruginibacter sp. HRS2-29]MCP9753329.1 hypothetical protein [Ferruginibacter sp. HRS2-29]